MDSSYQFFFLLAIGTAGMLLLAATIILFVLFYQKKMAQEQLRRQKLEASWDFLDIAVISSVVLVAWWVLAVILALQELRKLTVVENEAALLLRAPGGNLEENV